MLFVKFIQMYIYIRIYPLYDLDNFTSYNIGCFVFDINDYYIELIYCAYLVNNIILIPIVKYIK